MSKCLHVIILAVLLVGCSKSQSSSPSESLAKKAIETWFDSASTDILPLGQVNLIADGERYNRAKNETTLSDLPTYLLLASRNQVLIGQNIDLSDTRTFSWQNFNDAFQRDVRRRLLVTATPAGKKLWCSDEQDKLYGMTSGLCIDEGHGSVQEIVRSEQFTQGTKKEWPLCANMTETSLVTAISEQGGKENQYGNDERFCPARCGCDGSI
jgi:hypothetical protein